MIYLAHAIDLAGYVESSALDAFIDAAISNGDTIYRPSSAFYVIPSEASFTDSVNDAHKMWNINYHALDQCDILVAMLDSGKMSLGVPMEILIAVDMGKKIAVVADKKVIESSMILKAMLSRSGGKLRLFNSVDDLITSMYGSYDTNKK